MVVCLTFHSVEEKISKYYSSCSSHRIIQASPIFLSQWSSQKYYCGFLKSCCLILYIYILLKSWARLYLSEMSLLITTMTSYIRNPTAPLGLIMSSLERSRSWSPRLWRVIDLEMSSARSLSVWDELCHMLRLNSNRNFAY